MRYYKNQELAKLYAVSPATVWKWVAAARQGKLGLDLVEDNGKAFIANTTKNNQTIEHLIKERSKYRNSRGFKTVRPQQRFYELYTQAQIYDICTSIEIYREIPVQYEYFDIGAAYWDKYAQRLLSEETTNSLTGTLKLLDLDSIYLDALTEKYKRINVVDVGVGNALPVRGLLTHLIDNGKLGRYLALDISGDMLKIAQRNIGKWFSDQVEFEDYELDITREHFANILASEYVVNRADSTAYLVLLFGGTINNFREPDQALRVVRDSMGINDLLLYAQKVDTDNSRRYFDFDIAPETARLSPVDRMIFDLLSIDESLYDVEMGYDDNLKQRYIRVRFKVALAIEFDFEEGKRSIELKKGDTILVWRAWQRSGPEVVGLLERCGFHVLQSMEAEDQEYLLTVSRRKRVEN